MGTKNDEDKYEYSTGTSKNVNKNDMVLEPMKRISSNTLETKQFTLTKNYGNLGATHENKQKHKDFLGKCKPGNYYVTEILNNIFNRLLFYFSNTLYILGGCLDPPFGEDKYSYLPNLIDKKLTNENEIKNIDCECDKTFTDNSDLKPNKRDKMSTISALIKKEKSESLYATDNLFMYIKDTNSIITFPSISPSTEALNQHCIHKKTKDYSNSKESRSYNVSKQLLETYYISPKIKPTNKTSKNVSDSNPHLDTEITDAVLQNQELFLDETTLETPNLNEVSDKLNVNVPLIADGLNANEEIISNFPLSDAIESYNLLQKPRNNMEIDSLSSTEKGLTDINAIPENKVKSSMILLKLDKQKTSYLEMNKLGEDKTKRENVDKKRDNIKYDITSDGRRVTDKFDNNAEPKLLHNDYETIVKSQDHSFYTEHLSLNYLKNEDCSQRSEYSIKNMLYQTNNNDNIIVTNADNEKLIVKSQNSKSINKYLKRNDPVSDIILQERDQLVSKVTRVTSEESNVVTNYKKSFETIVATPPDLVSKNKDFEKIQEPREFSTKEINQDKEDTSNTSEENIKKKNPVGKFNALLDDHISDNYNFNIINTTTPFPLKEKNEAIVETVTKSTENCVIENKNNIETVIASTHFLIVNNEKSNSFIINEGEKIPSEEIDQAIIETVTKLKKSFVLGNESIETIIVPPQYHTVDKKNSKVINVATELPSTEIDQGIIETVTKNIKKIKTENQNSIETIPASPGFLTFNNKVSNMINETVELDLKEIDQIRIVNLPKSVESFITKNNNDVDTVSASPQYLIVKNRHSSLINVVTKVPSKEIDQVSIETVKKSITSFVTKKDDSIEIVSSSSHFLIVNNKNSNIINETSELLSKVKDNLAMANLTKSTENFVTNNKNGMETIAASPQYFIVNNKDSNLINLSAAHSSKEIDQVAIETVKTSFADFLTENKNIIETVSTSPHFLTINNENSNLIYDAADLPSKEKNLAIIGTLSKSLENFIIKNNNVMETVSALEQYQSIRVNTKDSSTINMAPQPSSKNVVKTLIESLLDLTVSNEDFKIINIAEIVSSNGIETTIKIDNITKQKFAPIQEYRLSNEELKLNNVVPNMYDSKIEHIIDPSNISTISVAKSSIETITIPQKDSSLKDEIKDFKITEVNIRDHDLPILTLNRPKNTDYVETVKSFQDNLKVAAQVTHVDEATKPYKIVEREDKSSADIFLVSETKSNTTNSINLISTQESNMGRYSNLIKNMDFEHINVS